MHEEPRNDCIVSFIVASKYCSGSRTHLTNQDDGLCSGKLHDDHICEGENCMAGPSREIFRPALAWFCLSRRDLHFATELGGVFARRWHGFAAWHFARLTGGQTSCCSRASYHFSVRERHSECDVVWSIETRKFVLLGNQHLLLLIVLLIVWTFYSSFSQLAIW